MFCSSKDDCIKDGKADDSLCKYDNEKCGDYHPDNGEPVHMCILKVYCDVPMMMLGKTATLECSKDQKCGDYFKEDRNKQNECVNDEKQCIKGKQVLNKAGICESCPNYLRPQNDLRTCKEIKCDSN